MNLLIVNDSDESIPEKFLQTWTTKLKKILMKRKLMDAAMADRELSIVFLKEAEAKRINWRFRGKDYATDILSFETEDPESVGELVICPVVIAKQAKEHKITFEKELGYMVLHGVLHLLGYDHETPGIEAEKMLKLQDELYAELNKDTKSTAKKIMPKKKVKSKRS